MASREEELLAAILGENWTECEPHSRIEKIWQYALQVSGVEPEPAHSRIEALAIQVAELVRNGGGGGDHTIEDGLVEKTLTSYTNNRVSTIGQNAMRSNSLTSVEFAEATTIADYAFYGITTLTSAKMPKAATLGREAFRGCSALTEIALPSVESLGVDCFRYCRDFALLNLYSPTRTAIPTMAGTNTIASTAIADGNGYIVINDDLVDTLKGATNWSAYASQIIGNTAAAAQNLI